MNRKEASAQLGAALPNIRWAWSAVAEGKWVVLTLWEDEFDYGTTPASYDIFSDRNWVWKDRLGNKVRIKHLRQAQDEFGGRFRFVLAKAEDPKADTRKIVSIRPDERYMQLVKFDDKTGEFRAVIVE